VNSRKKPEGQWYKVDLHIHTPASSCYAEPGVTYLDILHKAEGRGLDIIALTDHNTVAGYARMKAEIQQLEFLEQLERLRPEERRRLDEYRRLLKKILVLPGFEFTATLGFHILGIFPPETTVRELELILLRLNVPSDRLDAGSTEVGATTDVLTAYRIIDEAGGLVIAAHANSANGVAMRGLDFGGQTKIAYTQDPHLHALEVTDLESKGRRTTARFYNGSKPEYPRRMHCIQGSDAHRLTRLPGDKKNLGVGDRVTEVLLPEATFQTLKAVFLGTDFARTRPYRPTAAPFDHVQAAREQGPSIVVSFHESATRRGGRLHKVMCDVVAFANTNGGTIYIGLSSNRRTPVAGVENPEETVALLKNEIERKITPPLKVTMNVLESEGKPVIQIIVPKGEDPPYALEETKIYIRQETETNLAVRDEIVQLVKRTLVREPSPEVTPEPVSPERPAEAPPTELPVPPPAGLPVSPPKTGVEIIETVERKGVKYHTVLDLRNGSVVRNVTRGSARRLWRYAITQHETEPVDETKVRWFTNIGIWKKVRTGSKARYDLVQQDTSGRLHVYYGVTEEGIHGEWRMLFEGE